MGKLIWGSHGAQCICLCQVQLSVYLVGVGLLDQAFRSPSCALPFQARRPISLLAPPPPPMAVVQRAAVLCGRLPVLRVPAWAWAVCGAVCHAGTAQGGAKPLPCVVGREFSLEV